MPARVVCIAVHRGVHTDQAGVVSAQKARISRLVQTVGPLVPYTLILQEHCFLFVRCCIHVILRRIDVGGTAILISRLSAYRLEGVLLVVSSIGHARTVRILYIFAAPSHLTNLW